MAIHLPPVDRAAKVVISGTVGGTNWSNIFHFLWDTLPTSTVMGQLATEAFSAYAAQLMPARPSAFVLTTCTAEDLSTTPVLPGAAGGSVAGGNTDVGSGAQECMLVKHTIARRYRGGHPRTYVPPLGANTKVDIDRWAAGTITTQQTAWNAFIAAILGFSYTGNTLDSYINISYFSGHTVRVTPVIDLIINSIVEQTIATQRRRVGR